MKDEPILDLAKKRFKACQDAEARQRQRENDDLKFQVPELQWDDAAKAQRQGLTIGGVPIPPRPMLSISKLDQPIQLILNQARSARLGVNIHPVSEDADKEGAEIRQGLYRRIERDSNADQARLWALDRATKCGRGAYRINTKWDEDADPETFDQEIIIERILHQDAVYFDPSAQKPDFSDGEYAFVAVWMSPDKFKREFPDAKITDSLDNPMEWESLVEQTPEWVKVDGEDKAILVAEYWYKKHDYQTIKSADGKNKRERDRITVKVAKMTGAEVLEEQDWNGHYIPLVPVLGRELQPFDAQRRWVGMIGPSKDGQKFYNYAASNLVERMSLEPKAPFIGAEGQFEGHEAEWQQANIRNFPYLQYKPTTIGDKQVAAPARAQIDQSGMSISMMAMQEADRFIQTTTSVYDPSLGRENPRDKSGKAIVALQQQSDAGTSHFLSSLADISMPLEARIVLDLMPAIYDRPGRITTILKGDDDSTDPIMINAPFVRDQQTGRPQPVQPGMPQQGVKQYDLTRGGYAISVDIGKSFQTRLQQGADEMGQILASAPDLMPILGDLYFRFRDFPGATEIADRLKKLYEKAHPGEDEQEQNPEAVAAENQALKQQMQEMQQQLQAAAQAIETDQAKQQAIMAKAKLDAETRLEIARLDAENRIQIEMIKQQAEAAGRSSDQQHEAARDQFEAAHETGLALVNAAGKSNAEQPEPPERPMDDPEELDEPR
jgi:hypothetical protein